MTNKNIEILYNGIQNLRERNIRVPARVSFTLVRGARTLLPLVEDSAEAKRAILEQFGTPVENGQYKIPTENIDTVMQELQAIDDIDVPVELPHISMKDIENLDLSIQETEALDLILEEES